jgi:23S rRNA (uracil1939-C5)-methyltransferase
MDDLKFKISPKSFYQANSEQAYEFNKVTRDLQLMDEMYKITRIQPVDMFPCTHHVENVVLLERRVV